MIKNFFKIALRTLLRNKVYSGINVLGLSLGLAAAMLILLYVKDEVSYDRFYKNVNQIYRIGVNRVKNDGSLAGTSGFTGLLQGPRFTAGVPEIGTYVRLNGDRIDLKTGPDVNAQEVLFVDANFFSVFSFPLLSGNPVTALANPTDVVISEDFAVKQFGSKEAVGKSLLFRGDSDRFVPYIVRGIAGAGAGFAAILVCRFEMAGELSIPHNPQLVDICDGGRAGLRLWNANREFPGAEKRYGKSYKKFEVGIVDCL